MIFRVRIVFRQTVVGDWRFDYLSGSHLQSQVKSRRQMMVFMPLVLVLIGQLLEDNNKPITDTPGFKPFTTIKNYVRLAKLSRKSAQLNTSFPLAFNSCFVWPHTCTDFGQGAWPPNISWRKLRSQVTVYCLKFTTFCESTRTHEAE